MSTPSRSRRLDPAERRKQILDAANELFAERGYEDVLVEDIARAADVTRGLVHHYFGGRKEVFIALVERLGALREDQLRAPEGRNARERVADSVSRWLDWTETNRAIYLGTIAPGEDIADPDVRRAVSRPGAPRGRAGRGLSLRHRRGLAAAALRAGVLDRTEPGRHATLATRRRHPQDDARAAGLDSRTRPANVRLTTQPRRPTARARVSRDQWMSIAKFEDRRHFVGPRHCSHPSTGGVVEARSSRSRRDARPAGLCSPQRRQRNAASAVRHPPADLDPGHRLVAGTLDLDRLQHPHLRLLEPSAVVPTPPARVAMAPVRTALT